ncbi:hypothetical protein [Gandjariella thermophila]|uniref:Sulfotransferase family protein n=1 Tax=Gandjariella thermophila TaxID=1931992 RepID=A0A4D4J883_9PSEU|nr:hypothetical protein [Gandjariella thermophila]GDY30649.1 hypothetical protein GTS_22820 [Gandjariella thermophila]
MARRVYLHIGLPKTGTTSVQDTLWDNRHVLAPSGVYFPGYIVEAHYHAAIDLQNERYHEWLKPLSVRAWDRLVADIRAWPDTSVVSCELLATATSAEIERALSSLAFAEVHVICTARDLARQIPSAWQEYIKTGHTITLPELLQAVRTGEPAETSELFWDYQDLPQILRRWAANLPPERVHVVTVPQAGPGVWPRFASVIGVDPDRITRRLRYNTSMGAVETELLRRLNAALDMEWHHYAAVVKDQLARDILALRPDPHRITLPADDVLWLRKRAYQFVDEIREAGYHVVGDLDELVPEEPLHDNGFPAPADADMLDVAVSVLARMLPRVPHQWPRQPRRLKETLVELSERNPHAMTLRRLFWKGKARAFSARARARRS